MNWLGTILPRIDKNRIVEDLINTDKELRKGVIPSYDESVKFFGNKGFKSKKLIEMSNIFYRNCDLEHGKTNNFIMDIQKQLPNLATNLEFIQSKLNDILEKDIIKDGLTAQKAVLIRAGEHISFLTKFSVDLLAYVYGNESFEYLGKNPDEEEVDTYSATFTQVKNVESRFLAFTKMYGVYSIAPKDFQNKFEGIPDVIINENNYGLVSSTFDERKIDPVINKGLLLNFESNPIYHFRLMYAEWQASRYNSFKDKKKSLELRLLMLKDLKDNNKNPNIQQEINYLTNRIEGFESSMRKMEDSVS